MSLDFGPSYLAERAMVMRKLKEQGRTLQEIGDLFDMSRERVRQVLERHFGDNYPRRKAGRKPRA